MKKMKFKRRNRILGALAAGMLMLCSLLVPNMQVQAENLLIQLSQNSVKEGDVLTVTVMVPAGASATVYLNYSPDVFSYQSSQGEVDETNGIVSAKVNASGDIWTTFAVKFQAISAGKGSFVASSDDSANIKGASVVVSVQENPNADVSQPQENGNNEEPEGEPGNETQTEETGTQEQNSWYELDGEKLYPSMLIPSALVPDGFKEGKLKLWGGDYPCLYKENAGKKLALLYLVDENHENGALYMVEKNSPYEIYPFVCVDYQTYKGLQNADVSSPAKTNDKNNGEESLETLKSQNRLILYAFLVVVLILLIVIVVLMAKRREPWEEPEKLPRVPEKKPVTKHEAKPKKKPVIKQEPEPEKKPVIKREAEPKKTSVTRPKPEPEEKPVKKKKSAFWDAMFAGIDDDIGFDDFEDEKPETEIPKKEKTVKKQEPQPEKQRNPDARGGTDEDIEFIDL